ncbi:MAG: NTP/NDP exchange transporter [Simkaniaceae bacterium]|nr:NTP/NDP exchange transporter [Simkaniaceae bacterium]
MNNEATGEKFGKLRSLFWPIYRFELKKFIPMLLIYSLIVFNYCLLKSAKDPLVTTARDSGAEVLPFIKLWGILPMALILTFLFTRLSNRFNREKVFYIMMGIFLGFFALFSFVLYPLREYLHPHAFADWMQNHLPIGAKGLVSVFRNWSFTLFYVMSELWGTTIMTVLFWGFANEVSSINDAKRFYAILGVGANIATIVAGQFSILISKQFVKINLFYGDLWQQSLGITTIIVICAGAITLGIYYWMNRHVFKSCPEGFDEIKYSKPKEKMSLRKSFATLGQSKYLLYIGLIVLTYNIALNMVEIVWKDRIRELYPDPNDSFAYYGQVMVWIGIVSTFTALFVTGNVIRRFGWTISALVTPIILFITGILFFSFLLFKNYGLGSIAIILGSTPLVLSVFFGSIQNVLSRTCKFTFFDATKEMSFIPLDPEAKLKGKAAIDGVGSRLGKSGGSAVHQLLLIIFGSVSASTPYIAAILFAVVIVWMFSVKSLGRLFAIESHESDPTQEPIQVGNLESTSNQQALS